MKPRLTGLAAWWVQRASALVLLFVLLFVLVALLLHPRPSYEEWRGWVGGTGVSIAVIALFAALLSHAWVGLRDVLLDYAKPAGLRHLLLGLLAAGLLATAGWVVLILVRLQT